MACGGSAGFSEHLGGKTELQGDGTPHFHGSMVLASVYQFSTLEEIAELIEQDWLSVEAIREYQMHICREDHYSHEQHKEQEPALERAWKDNYAEPEHQGLCALPALFTDSTPATLWGKGEASLEDQKQANENGRMYKQAFEAHVQFVFFSRAASRVGLEGQARTLEVLFRR